MNYVSVVLLRMMCVRRVIALSANAIVIATAIRIEVPTATTCTRASRLRLPYLTATMQYTTDASRDCDLGNMREPTRTTSHGTPRIQFR